MRSFARILVCLTVSLCASAQAQITQAWIDRYNGPGNSNDEPKATVVDAAGYIYVCGASQGAGTNWDFATIKYDPDGNRVWVSRHNEPGNTLDIAADMVLDASGNVYVTGRSGDDTLTIKYDSSGAELWASKHFRQNGEADVPIRIVVNAAGSVFITATSFNPSGVAGYLTIKYDSTGAQQWATRYLGMGYDCKPTGLAVDADGSVYVSGSSRKVPEAVDYATVKYNASGQQVWVDRYSGQANYYNEASALAIDDAGYVYVTGYSWSGGSSNDFATIKYGPDGTRTWVARYHDPLNDCLGVKLATDSAGNVYVVGVTGRNSDMHLLTVKYNSSGQQLWALQGTGQATFMGDVAALTLDLAGNVYVACTTRYAQSGTDITTFKYSPEGGQQWVVRYNGSQFRNNRARSVALDAAGNLYVTGRCDAPTGPSNTDIVTLKYVTATLPDSFTLTRAAYYSGGQPDLLSPDDDYLVAKSDTLSPPVQLTVTGQSPVQTPNQFAFNLETHTSSPGLQQRTELWDYSVNAFVEVDLQVTTAVDSIVMVAPPNPARFVGPGSNQVKARITWERVGPFKARTWRIYIDQSVWLIH